MTIKSKLKLSILLILILVVVILGFALGSNNAQIVTFNYLLAQTDIVLSHLIGIIFGTGILLGWLVAFYFYMKMRIRNINLNRKLTKLQASQEANLSQNNNNEPTLPTITQ